MRWVTHQASSALNCGMRASLRYSLRSASGRVLNTAWTALMPYSRTSRALPLAAAADGVAAGACCAGARGAALRGAGVRGAARPHGLCEGPEPPSRGGRPPRPSCCVIVGSRSSCCLQCQTAVSGRFAVCVSIVLQHPQGRRRTSSDDDGKPLARWSVYGGRAEACRTSCRPAGARLK